MAVAEAQSAQVADPKVREIIADLMRRVGELEKQNGATERRQAEDAKVLAKIEAQIPFLATKEDVANLEKKVEVGLANGRTETADFRTEALTAIANLQTQIARMETQNERNSKNSIKWIVGTGVALAGVLVAAIGTMTGVILAALRSLPF